MKFNYLSSMLSAIALVLPGAHIVTIDVIPPGSATIDVVPRGGATTTSISFVKDVLFPYVLDNLDVYVGGMTAGDDARASYDLLDALGGPAAADPAASDVIKLTVRTLMKHDVKATVSSGGERRVSDFLVSGKGLTNMATKPRAGKNSS